MAIGPHSVAPFLRRTREPRALEAASNHCPGAGSAIPDHSPLLQGRPIPSWPGRSVWPSKRWGSGGPGSSNGDGLLDEPRPGGPRSITDTRCGAGRTLTLETTPADATHWSTRSMGAYRPESNAISRIWRAFAAAASDRDVQTFV